MRTPSECAGTRNQATVRAAGQIRWPGRRSAAGRDAGGEPGGGHVLVAVSELDRAAEAGERLRREAEVDPGALGHLEGEAEVLRRQLQRERRRVVPGDDLLAL